MNIFGIGFSEFFIIFLLALIILGPRRLPLYANKLGAKIREWRMMSQVFMVEWKEELAALEEARTSLEEAKQSLVEAQATITSEVKEVTETVASEMKGAQQDISTELNEAKKLVSDESNQVKETISEVAKGTDGVPEAKNISDVDGADTVAAPSDIAAETTAIEDNMADVPDEVSADMSDVLDINEDDLSDVIETRSIAPPEIAQQHAGQAAALDEIDVSEVQTVSDVATDVAEEVAQRVAAEVARRVTKNLTADMAEEVAALVMAKLAQAGINSNNAAEADSVETSSEPSILQEVVNE